MKQTQRPRAGNLLSRFPALSLSDEELLSTVFPKEEAARILAEYGNLYNVVMDISNDEILKTKGIGIRSIQKLQYLRAAIIRIQSSRNQTMVSIRSPEDIVNYMSDLQYQKQEQFHVIMLNTQNRIIGRKMVSQGTLHYAPVSAREIFHPAIKHMASRIVLVHNHPSGICKPSKEDIGVTEMMVSIGKEMDILVIDHIIIGQNEYYSLCKSGEILFQKLKSKKRIAQNNSL